MTPYEQSIIDNVERVGWHVTCVGPAADSDDPEEWFAYTVGLSKTFGWPEFICLGLDLSTMASLLNDAVNECRAREIVPSPNLLLSQVIEGFPAKLVENENIPPQYLNSAIWFARQAGLPPPSALQMLWPDTNGVFPDEPDCSEGVRQSQTPVEAE